MKIQTKFIPIMLAILMLMSTFGYVSVAASGTTAPTNFVTNNRGNDYTVSWLNPSITDITQINLYNVAGGANELLATSEGGSLVKTSGTGNYVAFRSNKGDWYNYIFKIVINFQNEATYTAEITSATVRADYNNYYIWGVTGAGNNYLLDSQNLNGWNLGVNGYPYHTIAVQPQDRFNGNAALKITTNLQTGINNTFSILQPQTNLTQGKKYKFTFYAKAVNNIGNMQFGWGWPWNSGITAVFPTVLMSDIPDWTKQEIIFTKDSVGGLFFNVPCTNVLIDDVKLYELDGNNTAIGQNLIANGSFENDTDYSLRSFVTNNRGTDFSVSWLNPKRTDITQINLYDVAGGANDLLATSEGGSLVKTSGSANNIAFKSNKGDWYSYTFKVVVSFGNGETFSSEITSPGIYRDYDGWRIWGVTGAGDNYLVDTQGVNGWELGVNGYPYHTIAAQAQDKRSGNGALKITTNLQAGISNTFAILKPQASLTQGKKYKFKFYAKAVNSVGSMQFGWGWPWTTSSYVFPTVSMSNIPDWTKQEVIFTKDSQGGLFFNLPCTNVLIDDAELFELDGSNNETGSNLLTNGGFETNLDYTAPSDVTNVATVPGEKKATISWNNPADSDLSKIIVYKKNGIYLTQIKELPKTATSYVLGDLNGGRTYEYILKSIDNSGNKSSGTTVTVKLPALMLETKTYSVTAGGAETEISSMTSGNILARATITNNEMPANTLTLVMAQYKSSGELIKVAISDKLQVPKDSISRSISVTMNAEAIDNSYIKVFKLNDTDLLKPFETPKLLGK